MKKIFYVVLNPDGTYAGAPCRNRGEAIDLAAQKPGRVIGELTPMPYFVEHFHCPVNGWDCPYYKNGICELDDPMEDCDDFASVTDEEDGYACEGGEDCAVWDKIE